MTECYGKKFIMDGKLYPANHFDNSMVYDGNSIYQVRGFRENEGLRMKTG